MFNFIKNKTNTDLEKYNNLEKKLYFRYGKANPINFNLKILTVTDTHNTIKDPIFLEKLEYDLCIFLGDISKQDIYEITKYINKDKIIGILGNHDEKDNLEKFNIMNINNKVFKFNNIKLVGIEGCLKYKEFQPGYSLAESFEVSDKLEKANILISHTIPYKFMGDLNEIHIGNPAITNYLYKNKCSLNLCGHNHNNKLGTLKNGTTVIETYLINLITITPGDIQIKKIEANN